MRKPIPTVRPELLIKANEAVSMNRGKGDVTVSIVAALGDDHSPDEVLATSHRLRALAKLVASGAGAEWTLSIAGRSYKLAHEAIFRAAAIAPLYETKRIADLTFDTQEFLAIALSQASPSGSA